MVKSNVLRRWGPVLLGAIVIWIFSTEMFSDQHTGKVIIPTLHWLFPWMTPRVLVRGHKAIRKLAHICVYFVFGVLLLEAIRGDSKGWSWWWAVAAIGMAAAYAVTDEIHQSFVPPRHPSARDVMLDTFGALVAQFVVWARGRMRERARS